MRNYKSKMNRYRLPPERYRELHAFCIASGRCDIIIRAATQASDSIMAEYIILHVTTNEWKWRRLEAVGIPCCGDAFRTYRARFYYLLNQLAPETGRINVTTSEVD